MSSFVEVFNQALKLQQTGDIPAAISAYQDLLTLYPNHLASRYNLACLLAEQQKWPEAINEFGYIITAEPTCTPAYYNLAVCYQGLQEDDQAIECLEQTLALEPQHPLATQALGSLLLKKHRYEEAKTYLLAALQNAPTDADILFNLGLALLNEGDNIAALYYFTKLRELKPHFIEAVYNCGVIYHQAGNYPAALRAYAQVLHYNSNHFASLYNSGLIYQLTQQYPLALDFYQRALAIEPNNNSLKFLISALQQQLMSQMPAEHVQNLFDSYAGHYDAHMQEELKYTVPQQLYDLFCRHVTTASQTLCLVDLGCGTGLIGSYFKDLSHTMVGVDISPKMLAVAANKFYYTTVTQQDNIEYLNKIKHDVDIVVAADVIGYYGDLTGLFAATQQALRKEGYWLFSIETHDNKEDYLLAPHARFTHHPEYIARLAAEYGFKQIATEKTILRYQQLLPVYGQLYLFSPK